MYGKNDPLSQAFRVYPATTTASTVIIHLPVQLDSNTGQRVVYWDDIQRHFRHAGGVMNDGDVVSFLKGADLEYHIPLRIAHHPGTVLEVLIGIGPAEGSDIPDMAAQNQSLVVFCPLQGTPSNARSTTRPVSSTHSQQYSTCTSESDNPFKDYSTRPASTHSQQHSTSSRPASTHSQQHSTSSRPASTHSQQQHSTSARPASGHSQHHSTSEMDTTQQFESQVMRRLTAIQNRIQILMVQTYELHEGPIPRLFIILPRPNPSGVRDQFRLYFLCECGNHTKTQRARTPEIHLADDTGYDLDKPHMFFRKYGSNILTMMYMIKYGVAVHGMLVQPLDNSRILDELKSIGNRMGHPDEEIGSLIDNGIKFLEDFKSDTRTSNEPEALEGADLRQLKPFLRVDDESRALGNLYRMVTPEGHVKWVCLNHYQINYREPVMRLRDIAVACGGHFPIFVETLGKVEIDIATNTLAKRFYEGLVRARFIQELGITLGWNATIEDIQELCGAVTKAEVVCLTIDGEHLNGSWTRDCRFDSIIQLASNGRIQSLRLVRVEDFFGRVRSPLTLTMAPRLRVFSIDGKVPFSSDVSFLSAILDNYPRLTELKLHLDQRYRTTWPVTRILQKLGQLKTLTLDYEQFSTTVLVSRGTIRSASMRIKRLCDLSLDDDLEFIQDGCLSQLMIESTPLQADEGRLVGMLEKNPGMENLIIGCVASRSFAILKLVISTRENAVQNRDMFKACMFELSQDQLVPWDADRPFDKYDHISAIVNFETKSSHYSMTTKIIMHNPHGLFEAYASQVVLDIIGDFGWSVESLRAPSSFGNRHAQLLDLKTEQKGSQLKIIDLDPLLDDHGQGYIRRVIERSPRLVFIRVTGLGV